METVLCDATELNDGQMLAPAGPLNDQLEHDTGLPTDERVGSGAGGSARPARARLEARPPACREPSEVDLVGSAGPESRVRALSVVPGDEVIELAAEGGATERDDR
jgi:hypothetical protein